MQIRSKSINNWLTTKTGIAVWDESRVEKKEGILIGFISSGCLMGFIYLCVVVFGNHNNHCMDALPEKSLLRLGSGGGSSGDGSTTSTTSISTAISAPNSALFSKNVGQGAVDCSAHKKQFQERDPNHGELFTRELRVSPPFTMSVHAESYDPVRWKTIYKKGRYYEGHVHARFNHILRAQSADASKLVMDVGANIGYFTLLSRSLGANVISFEVNPFNIQRICDSLQLNEWQQDVAIFHNGVFNQHGEVLPFDIPPENPGKAGLALAKGHRKPPGTVTIETTTITLDQFAQDRKWFDGKSPKIALLKIDVEGVEPRIIAGAKKFLGHNGMVENILTELRKPFDSEEMALCFQILMDSDYRLVDPTQEKKLSKEETQDFLEKMKHKTKGRTVDLWFQHASVDLVVEDWSKSY